MSLENLHLVVLTSNALFKAIKLTVYSLCLFVLQLGNRLAVKADPFTHIVNGMMLVIELDVEILIAVVNGAEFALQLINPIKEHRKPIIQAIVHCNHARLQIIVITGGKNQCLKLEYCKYIARKWTM